MGTRRQAGRQSARKENIKSFTGKRLLNILRSHYFSGVTPIICVAGGIDEKKLQKIFQNFLKGVMRRRQSKEKVVEHKMSLEFSL
jgi:hypothetical protein